MKGDAAVIAYRYDGEGKNTGGTLYSGGSVSYVYDADGQRIEKDYGSTVTDTIFFGGQPIARYSGGAWTDLVYGASGLLAEVPGSQAGVPSYRLTDHLGSVVATVPSSGAIVDYAPFGQIISGAIPDPYKFTGKERDVESGLDYFGARYYSSSMGRFMSPDWTAQADPVPWAELGNPQTLDLYSYVQNNPLNRTDPFGHASDPCKGIPNCVSVTADPSPSIHLTTMFLDGHHFIPQSLYKGASDLAKSLFGQFKTGTLPNPGLHKGYSGSDRAYTEQVRKIIQQIEEESGKPISQWGKEEIEKAVEEVRQAGGAVKSFLDHIEENNPTVKTVRDAVGWIGDKVDQIQSNPTVQQGEQNLDELEEEVKPLL